MQIRLESFTHPITRYFFNQIFTLFPWRLLHVCELVGSTGLDSRFAEYAFSRCHMSLLCLRWMVIWDFMSKVESHIKITITGMNHNWKKNHVFLHIWGVNYHCDKLKGTISCEACKQKSHDLLSSSRIDQRSGNSISLEVRDVGPVAKLIWSLWLQFA